MLKTRFSISFLSPEGLSIYEDLKLHCQGIGFTDIDEYELSMLAHNFDQFAKAASYVSGHGAVHQMPTKTGTYPMVHPEFLVMEKCQNYILKHSPKFGLNPADRLKPSAGVDKPAMTFNTDTPLRASK